MGHYFLDIQYTYSSCWILRLIFIFLIPFLMHIVLNRKCDLRNKTYKNMTPLPAPILTNVSSEQQQGEQIDILECQCIF